MYDLLTLSEPHELFEKAQLYSTRNAKYPLRTKLREQDYYKREEHFIPEIRTMRKVEYSSRLRELIRNCLKPRIDQRPTPIDLLGMTRQGLNITLHASLVASDRTTHREERVYFKGNEI